MSTIMNKFYWKNLTAYNTATNIYMVYSDNKKKKQINVNVGFRKYSAKQYWFSLQFYDARHLT